MKTTIRRILNLLLYLSFCAMLGTGLLMSLRLVPGSRGGRGLEVLGWDRHQWGDLHTWIAYAFAILLAAHLVLAWAWLKKVAAKGHLWRLIIGLAIGLTIILGFLLLPVTRREQGRGRTREALNLPMQRQRGDYMRVSSPSPGASAVTWSGEIQPLLAARCVECHGPDKMKGDFRADHRDDLFRKTSKGSQVLPGDSAGSRLVAIVSGTTKMKRNAKDHILPRKEVALIKTWIDAGAR